MTPPTIKCPSCFRQHAPYWKVKPNGKRVLSYRCDRFPKLVQIGTINGVPEMERHLVSAEFEMEYAGWNLTPALAEKTYKDAPEVWSKGWAKKQQGQQQHQLLLMVEEPK